MAGTSHSTGFQRCEALLALMFFTLFASRSIAQSDPANGFVLYPAKVEAFLDLDQIDRVSNNQNSTETDWELGVSLNQEGYYLDPAITWFLLDIDPALTRNIYEDELVTDETDGEQINYLFQLDIFRDTPHLFGLNLDSFHNSNKENGTLGSRYDNIISHTSAEMRWKNEAFPMSLTYREEILEQEFLNSQTNQSSERDELSNILVLTGRSSKLNLRVEKKELDDRVVTRNNDFEQDTAYVNHNLEWGNGSSLFSRIDYLDREGFNANERFSIDETANIKHTDSVSSKSSLRITTITQNIKSDENIASFQLNHKLFKNLNSSAKIYHETEQSDILDEKIHALDLQTRYNKNEIFGARINAGLGVGYKETDRDSTGGLIDTVDEAHVVPLSGSIRLDNQYIIPSTIVITNDLGTLVYTEGFDYEVNALPSNFTEIITIPGGQIITGDTILVSYQANSLPSQEFSTSQWNYGFGFDRGWVRFSHSDRESDDKLKSGADESFLNDTRFTLTDLDFNWQINTIHVNFSAERSFNKNSDFGSTTYSYQQRFSWPVSRNSRWNLSFNESFIEQNLRDTDLFSARFFVDWRPNARLLIKPALSYWQREDVDNSGNGDSEDEYMSASFNMHWNYRQVIMDLSYHHNTRDIKYLSTSTQTNTDEDRIMFTLTRRFY